MKFIKERIPINEADYQELNSDHSRWTKDEYAYWAAKFKSGYPAEGYGMYSVDTYEDGKGKKYITWEHYDSCD